MKVTAAKSAAPAPADAAKPVAAPATAPVATPAPSGVRPRCPHPGVLLAGKITASGQTEQVFSRGLGVAPRRVQSIISGQRRLTADTALRLGRYLGDDPLAWMSYQAAYELEQMEAELGGKLAAIRPLSAADAKAGSAKVSDAKTAEAASRTAGV
ncbi:HigA family addiction module antitoxin [Paraburkholderia adhaesiva]|uniref:HigA family addiction module antitoxin n=1 Tax=Paraburkholderia adhaesiva TaxID=2883244 RepID=UPI001F3E08E6|nr:HigA family addiction module antitoxin [Paraburkholderia adhaesiva]